MSGADWYILEELFARIIKRKAADPAQSYTAQLFAQGVNKISQKLGEEAVETVIASVAGDKENIISESADLLYHLLVLWAKLEVEPSEVMALLQKRTKISGLEEKQNRD